MANKPNPAPGFGFPTGSNGMFKPSKPTKKLIGAPVQIPKGDNYPLSIGAPFGTQKSPAQALTGVFPVFGGGNPSAKASQQVAASLLQSAPKQAPAENVTVGADGTVLGKGPGYLLPSPVQGNGQPDWMNELLGYESQAKTLGLGGGTDYDALIKQLQANGSAGDAKLAAMYSQLGGSVAGDATGIKSLFDQTGANEAATSDAARTSTDQAYQGTRDAQTAQLAALGIGDAAAVLAANGGHAALDQAHADSNIEASKANSLNLNSATGANALNYNTGVKEAVGQQGAEARSTLQTQLANKLAELESQKATDAKGTQTALFNAALQLKGLDPNDPANVAKAQQATTSADLSNQLKASQIALNVSKSQGSAKTLQDALSGSVSAYTALQKQYVKAGGDASDQKAFGQFVTNLKTINHIG